MNFFNQEMTFQKDASSGWVLQFLLALLVSLGFLFYPKTTQSSMDTQLNPIEKIYVPGGFDDNDDVVIMVYGQYDMSCEEIVSHDFEINEGGKTINLISRMINHPSERGCSGSFEPYYKEFNLGVLNAGSYKVVGLGPSPVEETLLIKESPSNRRDQFSYPEITEVRLGLGPDGRAKLNVDVPLRDSCQQVESVSVKRQGANFWEIYPIMSRVQKSNCEEGLLIQTKQIDLGEIPFDTHIFYIRSQQGESSFYFEALI